METVATKTPANYAEVLATKNYIKANNHAEAYVTVGGKLTPEDGQLISKKLFLDKQNNALVYEFYRIKAKEKKIYVIF